LIISGKKLKKMNFFSDFFVYLSDWLHPFWFVKENSGDSEEVFPKSSHKQPNLEFIAETNLPTHRGTYRIRSYRQVEENGRNYIEPMAIICGQIEGRENVVLRVHDQCFTSEVLGSLKCDCQQQLDYSLEYIKENSPGLVIYLQQEGRGIGLANKIAAYALQEQGLDTVEANTKLGFPEDIRNYDVVKDILDDLNISSVKLLTNNPRKIKMISDLGIQITERIPIIVPPNPTNLKYLQTKVTKMQHLIPNTQIQSL